MKVYHSYNQELWLIALGCAVILPLVFGAVVFQDNGFIVANEQDDDWPYLLIQSGWWLLVIVGLYVWSRQPLKMPIRRAWAIIWVFFVVAVILSLFNNPTRSNDFYYYALMTKGFVENGLIPYETVPDDMTSDLWSSYVSYWRESPFAQGPMSILFNIVLYWAASWFRNHLTAMIIINKIVYGILLAGATYLTGRISDYLGQPKERIITLALFMLWNPFWLQHILIDLHNDVIIGVLVAGSVLAVMKRKEMITALLLVLGGLIKYAPFILLAIPAWRYWQRSRHKIPALRKMLVGMLGLIALAVFIYWPFVRLSGWHLPTHELPREYIAAWKLPVTLIIQHIFHVSDMPLRMAGLAICAGLAWFWIRQGKLLYAATLPVAVLFLAATPYFTPWYMAWILPLMLLYLPPCVIAVASGWLLVTPDIFPTGPLLIILVVDALVIWILIKIVKDKIAQSKK